jgi:P-type Ca2+ transporter type 2C
LATIIGKIGIFFAVLIFKVAMIRWGIRSGLAGRAVRPYDLLEYFIDAVDIVVVAIPEGLPLAITLGLAFAMRKMMADKNLARRLEACETMGSATQLNAEMTGTLTQNCMSIVKALWSRSHVVY